jgi:rhodanese-related sulfurtransferase
MKVSRRFVFALTGALSAAAVLGYTQIFPTYAGEALDATTAQKLAAEGTILLIDIRRPDEWAATGSGAGANRLDMRREDFARALSDLAGGNRDAPIALICAKGVRSARLANQLQAAGFTHIINVPEGMLGSAAGPGWIARGLPLNTN